MKIYLLQVKVYNYIQNETEDEYTEVFSNFDRAKEYGLEFLSKNLDYYCKNKNKSIKNSLKDESIDYNFTITEQDIEYSEKFNKQLEWNEEIEEYLIYEPTHKEYILDYEGKITDIHIMYLPNQKQIRGQNSLYMKPHDLCENAGKKFEIGDIVKIVKYDTQQKNDLTYSDYYRQYSEMYVVKHTPRRIEGQKYLRNMYALSEIRDEDYAPGIYTKEFHEDQIAEIDVEIEKDSPIDVLSKIYKNEIKINNETWRNLKYGVISFREIDKNQNNYYKKVLNLEKEN